MLLDVISTIWETCCKLYPVVSRNLLIVDLLILLLDFFKASKNALSIDVSCRSSKSKHETTNFLDQLKQINLLIV